MGIKVEDGAVLINCFTCGFKAGQLSYLFKRLAHHHPAWQPAVDACEQMEMDFFVEGLTFLKTQGYLPTPKKSSEPLEEKVWLALSSEVHPYWGQRGIDETTVLRWGCAFDQDKNRVVIPVRDQAGRLWGGVGRSINDQARPKYLNYFDMRKSDHLLGAHTIDQAKSIVVVEGAFDAMKASQALYRAGLSQDYGVVALMGSSMSTEQIRRVTSFAYEVVLALDADDAGRQGQQKAYDRLYKLLMTRRVDFRSQGIKDFGEASDAQVVKLIKEARLM